MRIAIVDDLAAERALLKDRLEQQLHRRNVQADILEYESGETFLEAARKAPFTAAFLDIYMDGMTGMEAAKELRKTNTDCLLVFTTTSTDHALEGFQVRALHYLVKPFTEADIDALTDELLARIPQPDKYMELKVEGSEIHLRYQDIVYAEHFAHLIYVHTTVQKTLATRQPFKTFIAPLVVLVIDRLFQNISKSHEILVFGTEYKVTIANQIERFAELFVNGLLLLYHLERLAETFFT